MTRAMLHVLVAALAAAGSALALGLSSEKRGRRPARVVRPETETAGLVGIARRGRPADGIARATLDQ